MRRMLLSMLLISATTVTTAFAAQPPKEFLDLPVGTTAVQGELTWSKVGSFTRCIEKTGSNVSWEKNRNGWIFTSKRTDSLTKKKDKVQLSFTRVRFKEDKVQDVALLGRIVTNNKEISSTAIYNIMASDLMQCSNPNLNHN